MGFLGKIFKKKDNFSLDSNDDPFKNMGNSSGDPLATPSDPLSQHNDPLSGSTTEQFEHGTMTTSKEFSPIGSTPMQSPTSSTMEVSSGGSGHMQELMQRDMQIISAKLDAIKANVEILSHKVESLEKATIEKKKNTYW